MVKTYAEWIMRWRWAVVLMSLVMLAIFISGARFLHFNNNYRVFFSADNPQLTAFENLQDTYSKADNVIIALKPKDGQVFTRETLSAIVDITERAWQTPYSNRVDSLANFQYTQADGDDLLVRDLLEDPMSYSDEDLARIRDIALHEPLLVGRIVASDAAVTGINVVVEMPGDDPNAEVPQVAEFARALAADIRQRYPNLEVYLSGVVMLNNAFPEASKSDMQSLVPLAFAVILVMLVFLLRSFSALVSTFIVIALSILSGMGLAGWIGVELSPPVMSAPVIILTLAVADCVHLLVSWRQGMRDGLDKRAAMVESLRINFQPVFLTSITTALGFMSLNFSDAPPFRHLGNTAAMGVVVAYLLSITLLPALIAILPARAPRTRSRVSNSMTGLAEYVIRNKNRLFYGFGVFALVLIAFIPRNQLNDVFVRYFDKSIEFRTDSEFIAEHLTGIYNVDYSLESGEPGGISDPAYLAQVDALARWFREQPETLFVGTLTDIMKRLNKNMHGDDVSWYRLPQTRELSAQYLLLYEMSLPYGLDLNDQINVDKSALRLSVIMKTLSTNEVLAFEERAHDWMGINTPSLLTYGASPTIMFAHIGQRNIKSMLIGTTVALVLISIILIFALRSLKYGLISLVPNLIPAAMAFGFWGIVVGEVGLSLSIVAAMSLGVVVDDTVHFLSKYLRARREQGLGAEDAIRYAFSSVGVALWVTSVTLVAGFLVLSTSAFQLNSGMGLLTAITLVLALAADFLFLPPLLLKIEERFS